MHWCCSSFRVSSFRKLVGNAEELHAFAGQSCCSGGKTS